jgi:hypothetical protein
MEKITLAINKRLMDIIFERVDKDSSQKEDCSTLIQMRKSEGVKVQSVFTLNSNRKTDEQKILNWLKNKIQNVHVASYENFLAYKEENQRQEWFNIPIQNERFLETKKLYEDKHTNLNFGFEWDF